MQEIEDSLKEDFFNSQVIQRKLPKLKEDIYQGKILPTRAARILLDFYLRR